MASPGGSQVPESLPAPAAPGEQLSPEELQLLARLEEQNQLLEADSKSLCSVNGARRASASSPGPGSLALSQLGPLEEETWSLWGRIVSDWDEWRKEKEKLLKELIRKGIPQQFRAAGWQRLCGAAELPLKARYPELLWVSSPCERLICRNFARTYPEHTLFSGQRSLGQQVLFNVRKPAARSFPQDPEHKHRIFSLGKKTHQSSFLMSFCRAPLGLSGQHKYK